jgi:hypothetical protein
MPPCRLGAAQLGGRSVRPDLLVGETMSIRSLADFNGTPRVMRCVIGTFTVTARATTS